MRINGNRIRWASLVTQTVKNLPAMQETRVRSLDQGDPREKEIATNSSVHAWRTVWTGEPSRLQFMEMQQVGHDSATHIHRHTHTHTHTHTLPFYHISRFRKFSHWEKYTISNAFLNRNI